MAPRREANVVYAAGLVQGIVLVTFSGTYLISGALLAVSAWLFDNGDLTANSQIFVWVVIFFFASAAPAAPGCSSATWSALGS